MRPLAVCGALTRDQVPCLAAIARGAQLDASESLFYENDPATEVFTVTSGMLKLSKLLPDGRRQITGAEAVTPVRICRFSSVGGHASGRALVGTNRFMQRVPGGTPKTELAGILLGHHQIGGVGGRGPAADKIRY